MGTELFAVADFVLIANHMAAALAPGRHAPISARIVAARPGPIALAGGHLLQATPWRGHCDLLVVPGLEVSRFGGWGENLASLQPELRLLQRAASKGTPLASVCIGAFLLAEAGVLKGRRIATAWLFERDFAARYPQARLAKGAVVCDEQDLITTGAVTSALDLGQLIARRHFGIDISRAAARVALLGGIRASQQPYVDPALLPVDRESMATRVDGWLAARLAQPYHLVKLADAFNMSTRTLLRRYREETGTTPLTRLQQVRVEKAKQLLEADEMRLDQIVGAVGYQDVATFSRLFRKCTGNSPAQYRRRLTG